MLLFTNLLLLSLNFFNSPSSLLLATFIANFLILFAAATTVSYVFFNIVLFFLSFYKYNLARLANWFYYYIKARFF